MRTNYSLLIGLFSILLLQQCKKNETLSKTSPCSLLEEGFRAIKEGKNIDPSRKDILKIFDKLGILKPTISNPVPDKIRNDGIDSFKTINPNLTQSLWVDYKILSDLIFANSTKFDHFRIQYVFMDSDMLQTIQKSMGANGSDVSSFANNIYAIGTLVNSSNESQNQSYVIFNTRKAYPVTIDKDTAYDALKNSSVAASIKNYMHNPHTYIARSVIYSIPKVQAYFTAIEAYKTTCSLQPVKKIKFDFCFGPSSTSAGKQDGIFLTTMPLNQNGQEYSKFPYYDQGNLEP